MKLRMKGNSLRLRIVRSELERLQRGESVTEKVYLAPGEGGVFGYCLAVSKGSQGMTVSYESGQINVQVSPEQLKVWFREDQVGIYASLDSSHQLPLEISIEKDFACLDRSDEDNSDTFENPLAGNIC